MNRFEQGHETPKPAVGQLGQMAKGVDSPDNHKSEISQAFSDWQATNARERTRKVDERIRQWTGK